MGSRAALRTKSMSPLPSAGGTSGVRGSPARTCRSRPGLPFGPDPLPRHHPSGRLPKAGARPAPVAALPHTRQWRGVIAAAIPPPRRPPRPPSPGPCPPPSPGTRWVASCRWARGRRAEAGNKLATAFRKRPRCSFPAAPAWPVHPVAAWPAAGDRRCRRGVRAAIQRQS